MWTLLEYRWWWCLIKEATSLAGERAHQELLPIPSTVWSHSTMPTTLLHVLFYNIYLLTFIIQIGYTSLEPQSIFESAKAMM